jgi:hypothetical protein
MQIYLATSYNIFIPKEDKIFPVIKQQRLKAYRGSADKIPLFLITTLGGGWW